MRTADLPPVEDLVPHRGESLMLDRVLEHDGESTVARVVVSDCNYLKSARGSIAPWIALEYMSQCIAAHESLLVSGAGGSRTPGYLTSAIGVRLHRSRFEVGEKLRVATRRARGRPGLGVVSHFCAVYREDEIGNGELLAEGRLTISIARRALPLRND